MSKGVKSVEEVICANEGCNVVFVKSSHNQKYHDDNCCRLATNRRIMEKYYARRDQRLGKTRYCSECKSTKLSRYNDDTICSPCKTKKHVEAKRAVVDMLLESSLDV